MPRRFIRMPGWVAVGLALSCGLAQGAAPNWAFDAYIRVPYRNTLFMAQDAQGNLYATTFNNSPNADVVRAFKITDPAGASPTVTAIDQAQAPAFRGYSGIAVDETGNVYLSFDPGTPGGSYIKKLLPTLQPDESFGNKGVLTQPDVRFQGLAAAGGRLIAALSWGRIAIFSAETGEKHGESPAATGNAITIRDIDYVPSTQELVGVDRDTVYTFAGGTLDNPAAYILKPLLQGSGRQTAGQAIYYHAGTDRIYYTRTALGHLGSTIKSSPAAEVIETVGTNPGGPLADPADAVISADGTYMFVSDMRGPAIMRYKSGSAGHELAAAPALPAGSPHVPAAAPPVPTSVPPLPTLSTPQPTPGTSAEPSIAGTNVILPVPAKDKTLGSAPSMAALNGTPLQIAGGAVAGSSSGGSTDTTAVPATAPLVSTSEQAASPDAAPANAITNAGTPNWQTGDLRRALSKAFASKQKLVAFFTSSEVELSRQVEADVFDTPGFAAKFPDALWLHLSLNVDRADVERYGVFRVPTLIIFTPNGEEAKRLSGKFTRDDFLKAFTEVSSQTPTPTASTGP